MKHLKLFATVIILILLVSAIAATSHIILNKQKEGEEKQQKPFYVGVTYCGSSIQEAKELIDKVKNYTNLFILQSGPLLINTEAINEIGDYACAANLSYAIYCSKDLTTFMDFWVMGAKERWGEQFIGIYFNDEPGGNMLDDGGTLKVITTINNKTTWIERVADGTITFNENVYNKRPSNTNPTLTERTYHPDGRISVVELYLTEVIIEQDTSLFGTLSSLSTEERQLINGTINGHYKYLNIKFEYYPSGTITIKETTCEDKYRIIIFESINEGSGLTNTIETEEYNINVYTAAENITKYPRQVLTYEEVLKQNPLQTFDDIAEIFVNMNKENLEKINKTQLEKESILVFTADYGLYWWDYKGGYDVILAQLGWNHTMSQDIGLVRGAAKMQNKSWGTIITWKYDQPPYLADGNETYEQLKTSYEAGAEYVIIFNYSEDPKNPNTLQEEHFQALERFWNDVVQNPKVKHGGIKAEAVLVLPQNYGWGMRHPQDTIWGIWPTDDKSQQIWNQLQNKLDKHGLKLDIIYEDPNYPVTDKYNNIYYWNQK